MPASIHYVDVEEGSVAPLCENMERFLLWTKRRQHVTCVDCQSRLVSLLPPPKPAAADDLSGSRTPR